MIYTHYVPLTHEVWTPLVSTLGKPVFWQFLPPTIAMWVRVDGARAVQVRDYTRVRGTHLELFTLCQCYAFALLGDRAALTIIEFDGDEEPMIGYDAKETFYDSAYGDVIHAPAYPAAADLAWSPAGWCLELEVAAYGGNNDGAPAALIELTSLAVTQPEAFFIVSPGIRHIRRPCIQVTITRFDWTGGANLPTMDCYGWIRTINVGVT